MDRNTELKPALHWRVLAVLNLYRVLVPLMFGGLYVILGPRLTDLESKDLFVAVATFYLCFGLVNVILVRRRLGSANLQIAIQATVDIAVLSLLLHVFGGVPSGLGLLFLLPVGGMASVVAPRYAFLLAAVATVAILGDTIVQNLSGRIDITSYATAGLLGAVLFILAAASSFAARSMRESEALVRQKELDLANLADLSQYIVQHLRESILVVDSADRIRLINESAAEILGDEHAVPSALIGEVSPRLLYSLATWRQSERSDSVPASFVAADGARLIQPHFAPLGTTSPGPTLIFLEDTSLLAERVQQGKLAALGRLSASIAHEIRNPVGAMSHAGQLLAESPHIGPDEKRLTDIIRSNSDRVSTIINNVLQLSRREAARLSRLDLGDWFGDFIGEFCQTMQINEAQIGVQEAPGGLEVRYDPSHLHQVVWNLCENAIKYGEPRHGVSLEVRLGRLNPSSRPFLEVADHGPGIAAGAADRIFEPFFTGDRKGGTGLGLFIARELCQLNRAVLLYEPREGGGSIFRIVFSDPQRWAE